MNHDGTKMATFFFEKESGLYINTFAMDHPHGQIYEVMGQ